MPRGAVILVGMLASVIAILCLQPRHCRAEPDEVDGHAEMHEIYKTWKIPGTTNSCCNDKDCRPTRAYVDPESGEWKAWDGKRWIYVPRGNVLEPNKAGDGRSHICEDRGRVYCFTPGEIRS